MNARSLAAPEERDRLERALEQLELARIGTIHAFCGDLLHERLVEAGIDPLFEVASEEEAEALADEAFEGWFQRALADPPEGIRRILRRRSGMQSPREQLRTAMQSLHRHRDFPEPGRHSPFDRSAAVDTLMDELGQLREAGSREFAARRLPHPQSRRGRPLRRRDSPNRGGPRPRL
jgi:ATP-dependent helicase/nuclease subunit A